MKGSPSSRTDGVGAMVSSGAGDRAGTSSISPVVETPIFSTTVPGLSESIPPSESLVQQVAYLKTKLEEEHANYKRKLQAYQDGQQRQAQLVQKLQQKVSHNVLTIGNLVLL